MNKMRSTALTVTLGTALVLTGCTGGSSSSSTTTSNGQAGRSASASQTANPQVAALLKQGISQAQAGQLDQAATTFTNVLTLDPGNKFAYYNLGLIAQTKKDAAGAVKDYDKALQTDGSYTPAMYNKAIALEPTNLDGAIQLYEKIVSINDKASTAYYRLSLAYDKKGDKDKAAAARSKALQIDPGLANPAAPASPTSPAPSPTPSR